MKLTAPFMSIGRAGQLAV